MQTFLSPFPEMSAGGCEQWDQLCLSPRGRCNSFPQTRWLLNHTLGLQVEVQGQGSSILHAW